MDANDPRLRPTLPSIPHRSSEGPAGAQARLVFVEGARRGEIVALDRSPMAIGRKLDNELSIDSERVSRSHARLERGDDGSWTITDLSSVNGTAVNGRKLTAEKPLRLTSRDVVQLPEVTLIFLQPGRETHVRRSDEPRALDTIHLDADRIRAEADEAIRNFLQTGDSTADRHDPG